MNNITAIYSNEDDWIICRPDISPSDLTAWDDHTMFEKWWHNGMNRELFLCKKWEKWCNDDECDPQKKSCQQIKHVSWTIFDFLSDDWAQNKLDLSK